MFSAGLSVGLTNIASDISIGIAGSSCAIADAQDASKSNLKICKTIITRHEK